MLVLWLLCWAHCSLSRFGAVQGSIACTCCFATNEHAEDSHDADGHQHDAPRHTSVDCGVCDFLTNGTPLMQKLPPLTAQAAAVVPAVAWEPAPLPVLATASFTLTPAHDPPPLRAFCELLSRTACPVRGPTQA